MSHYLIRSCKDGYCYVGERRAPTIHAALRQLWLFPKDHDTVIVRIDNQNRVAAAVQRDAGATEWHSIAEQPS